MSVLSRLLARRALQNGKAVVMSQHTVASFDADLKALADMIADMGARAGRSLAEATRALIKRKAYGEGAP